MITNPPIIFATLTSHPSFAVHFADRRCRRRSHPPLHPHFSQPVCLRYPSSICIPPLHSVATRAALAHSDDRRGRAGNTHTDTATETQTPLECRCCPSLLRRRRTRRRRSDVDLNVCLLPLICDDDCSSRRGHRRASSVYSPIPIGLAAQSLPRLQVPPARRPAVVACPLPCPTIVCFRVSCCARHVQRHHPPTIRSSQIHYSVSQTAVGGAVRHTIDDRHSTRRPGGWDHERCHGEPPVVAP